MADRHANGSADPFERYTSHTEGKFLVISDRDNPEAWIRSDAVVVLGRGDRLRRPSDVE
ncbi:MAG: hypothetical protein ABEJ28_10450 [Salinigranum sp.]